MLESVEGVSKANLADNAVSSDVKVDVATGENLSDFVAKHHATVNALPFYLNQATARACAEARRSYFDFSEDVASSAFVKGLAENETELVFVPQCGLAPGAINIIGASLIASLDEVKSLELRVGALPLSASNQMKYYLSCLLLRVDQRIHPALRCALSGRADQNPAP